MSALLGVALTHNPLRLLASARILVLGSAFFSCLSMTIAGIALKRDRLIGIGQAITMPLSSARELQPGRGAQRGVPGAVPSGQHKMTAAAPQLSRTRTGAPRA